MFIKQDYDYVELAQFIKVENLQLYYLIKRNHQEDNFVMMIENYVGLAPTEDELNDFMYKNKDKIKDLLFLEEK